MNGPPGQPLAAPASTLGGAGSDAARSAALAAALAPALGLHAEELHLAPRRPLAHQSNRLHDLKVDGRHLIVKEYLKPEEWAAAPLREWRALRLLAPLDLAPRPIAWQPASLPGGGPLVVYEWLAGTMWDRRRPAAADLARLAELWLQTHTVSAGCDWPSRGSERPLDHAAAEIAAGLQAYATWAEAAFPAGRRAGTLCLELLRRRGAVVDELAARTPPLLFCRSDQRFANVIARPDGRLGLVDWEDSGLRDPARDVADLLSHANQEDLLSLEEWRPFLEPYLAALGPTDPDLGERVQRYLALWPLFWLSVLLQRGVRHARAGTLATWRINDLWPELRLRRYLARALAWPELAFEEALAGLDDMAFFPTADTAARGQAGSARR